MGFGRPFSWFFFYRDDLREWIFFTTRTPFASAIAGERPQPEGFCSWVLGTEDPASGSLAFAQVSAGSARFVVAALICKYGGLPHHY